MFGMTNKQEGFQKVLMIEPEKIGPNPSQPRRTFREEELYSLADSIRQNGILQPLTVRLTQKGEYELVAGERRLRAAKLCQLGAVPCIELELSDTQSAVLALIENLQRQDLGIFEEAEGIAKLIEVYRMTQAETAKRLGKTQSTVANKLRLLRLDDGLRKRICEAGLTERHARALLRLEEADCPAALDTIIKRNLNVAETEKYIDTLLERRVEKPKHSFTPIVKDMRLFVNTVKNAVDVIRKAGLDAVAVQQESEDFLEFVIRIPKQQKRA